jgi:hypothetical protein
MKTVISSEHGTKIVVFLLAIFCAAALHHVKVTAQIVVEANDSLSDVGNITQNQREINANPDITGAGYLLAQTEAGKQMPASKSIPEVTTGDASIVIQEGWIYYSNPHDGSKLYVIKTDGSGRQKLNDDRSWNIKVSGDRIYYVNSSDGGKLYTIKIDGSDRQKLSDD